MFRAGQADQVTIGSRCELSGSAVGPRHPAHDRHRRQHPSKSRHDIEDRLQQAGFGQPRRLGDGHSQQRPHHDQHQQGDGSEEFAGAYRHGGYVRLVAGCAREGADYKGRANSIKRALRREPAQDGLYDR